MAVFGSSLLFCVLFTTSLVSADNLEQAGQNFAAGFKSLGDIFVQKYNNVNSFFASSKDELVKKVNDTTVFLGQVNQNMDALMADAKAKGDTELQKALDNAKNQYQQVQQFQQQVQHSTEANVQQLSDQWKTQSQQIYNGGLDKIIAAAQAAKNNGDSIQINSFLLSSAFFVFIIKFLLH